MKIRIVGHEGQPVFPFGETGPWREFANIFSASGHEIVMDSFDSQVDVLISNRHSTLALKEAESNFVPKDRRFLILWEPKIVDESPYRKSALKNYGHTFAPSPFWASSVGGQTFRWPQRFFQINSPALKFSAKKTTCVIMQGNKFSARVGEMYSFRRKVINECNKNGIALDLYGPDWNKGFLHDLRRWTASALRTKNTTISLRSLYGLGVRHSNYRGIALDKTEILQSYDISIVIENSLDYVSEKLFDAVQARNIVIYVGPDLEAFGIRSENFLRCSRNTTEVIELIRIISQMSLDVKNRLISNQLAELNRIKNEWNSELVLTSLAKQIVRIIS